MEICKNAGMQWDDLRYILAVARAGTMAAAARRLEVDQTTVARRVAAAEAALGTRLFDRRQRRLSLTPAGEAAVARAARVEHEIEALEQGIGDDAALVAGTVRITAVPVLVNHLLVPAAGSLLSTHPRLRLELIAEPRNLDLTRGEADIALRLARPEKGSAVARRIGWVAYAAYAPLRGRADRLPWIRYEAGLGHLPQARWLAAVAGAGAAPLALNDAEAILQAVRAGLGKSLLPCFLAEKDPALRRLGPRHPVVTRELWLLVHPELRVQARIAAVMSWIAAIAAGLGKNP